VGSRSICQARDVLDVWCAVGAGQAIADAGVTWTTARTFYRDRELFSWSFVDRGASPLPAFVNISQSETERILDEAMATQPLIDVRWGREVVGLDQSGAGVTVRCAGGETVHAQYAVVCAGAHADALRRALAVEFPGRSFADRFLICDIRADLPGWETERRFYFDPAWNPDRQVLIHPCPDSTYRIDWQVPPDADLGADAVHARIRQVVGDVPYDLVWSSVYRFQSRHADRFRVGRVLLAGDAAHVMAPFGARGLNSGVADAENAAWKIAYVLRGWAPPALLDSYHDERLAAALENLDVTGATMDFLVPQTPEAWAHRRDALDSGDPAQVDSGRFSEPFWYLDSPLTTPDESRTFAGRPPRGESPVPVPGVLVPDAPIRDAHATRFRELVRDGLLALTVDVAAPGLVEADIGPAPLAVRNLAEIDPSGRLRAALGARDGEIWLIRPDGHVAAIVTSPEEAVAAARVALLR
jgi:2-polyprenyl-6-methoxyphenol hydroxylase-like FAD-dependent oxidoreductase